MSIEEGSASEALESRRAQAIVQAIETAVEVRRRYQFFVWTQGSIQTLLPHKLAVCGVYERARKEVRLEVFNTILVPAPVLALLSDGQSPFMQHVISAWINNRNKPLVIRLSSLTGRALAETCEALVGAGFQEILVH